MSEITRTELIGSFWNVNGHGYRIAQYLEDCDEFILRPEGAALCSKCVKASEILKLCEGGVFREAEKPVEPSELERVKELLNQAIEAADLYLDDTPCIRAEGCVIEPERYPELAEELRRRKEQGDA